MLRWHRGIDNVNHYVMLLESVAGSNTNPTCAWGLSHIRGCEGQIWTTLISLVMRLQMGKGTGKEKGLYVEKEHKWRKM